MTALNELIIRFSRSAWLFGLSVVVALALALVAEGVQDTAAEILGEWARFADASLPGWRDDAGLMATIALIGADRNAAIDHALADLNEPLSEQLDWELNYRHMAWAKPLLADERIATRVAELDAETRAAADDVRTMLSMQIVSVSRH